MKSSTLALLLALQVLRVGTGAGATAATAQEPPLSTALLSPSPPSPASATSPRRHRRRRQRPIPPPPRRRRFLPSPPLSLLRIRTDLWPRLKPSRLGTRPPVIERPGVTLVPYGYASATLRCAPLRVCAVELARGEQVLHVATGDSERWAVQPAASGAGGATPLLFVKPTACNLTTNLVVTTDRHVYQLLLDSPPCEDAADRGYNPHLPYTPLVRFYHPNEFVETWSRANARASEARRHERPARRRRLRGAQLLLHLALGAPVSPGRPPRSLTTASTATSICRAAPKTWRLLSSRSSTRGESKPSSTTRSAATTTSPIGSSTARSFSSVIAGSCSSATAAKPASYLSTPRRSKCPRRLS